MNLILQAIKSLFRKEELNRPCYDTRQTANTAESTVSGTTIDYGYLKCADVIDFDVNTVVSLSIRIVFPDGNTDVVADIPVELVRDYGNEINFVSYTEDFYDRQWGTYFPTQKDADIWFDDPESENPFGPGLYLLTGVDKGIDCTLTYSFGMQTGELKKLDSKFLPDELLEDKLSAVDPVGNGSFSMNRLAGSVIGLNSHAEGTDTTASGNHSHAEGTDTTASGNHSHAEGCRTTASGYYSHAEGTDTTASGNRSHAEGYRTTASEEVSHAEGYSTTASGAYSHAEGYYTTASRAYSHAEGYCTIAAGRIQHAQGKYNVEDSNSKYAHIVGNGTSDTAHSNAHTLDWEGNAWFQGDVYVGGTGQDDESAEKLAKISDIPEGFSGSWNDLTEKPFGEDCSETLFEGTVTPNDDGVYEFDYFEFVADTTYRVVWNGVEYECECECVSGSVEEQPVFYIGNPAYAGGEDNGLPFIIISAYGVVQALGDSTSATVSVVYKTTTKLSGQYIEDMYYTEPDTFETLYKGENLTFASTNETPWNKDTDVYAYADSTYVYADHEWINTESVGKTFIVIWDGTSYECVAHNGDGLEKLCIGNAAIYSTSKADTGEPFLIMADIYYDSQGLCIGTLDTAASHSMEICNTTKGEVHKIEEKYLPDNVNAEAIQTAQATAETAQATAAVKNIYAYIPTVSTTSTTATMTVKTDGAVKSTQGSVLMLYLMEDINLSTDAGNYIYVDIDGVQYIVWKTSKTTGSVTNGYAKSLTSGLVVLGYLENPTQAGSFNWYLMNG